MKFDGGVKVYIADVCFPERPSNIEKGAVTDEEDRYIVFYPTSEVRALWWHYDLNEHGRRRALKTAWRVSVGDIPAGAIEEWL